MLSLFLLSLFVHHSVQLPRPQSASTLQRRGHPTSYYTCPLTKGATSSGSQTSGTGGIIDNGRVKYLFPITVGGQTLDVELDTGSSDTWLIQSGFECFDTFDYSTAQFVSPEADSVCKFGPPYTPGAEFVPSQLIQLSCYGQTESTNRCVGGEYYGTADVGIAGLTIPQQLIGAPLKSSFRAFGQPIESGLIGMAFENLTKAYNTAGERVPYSPIMNTLFEVDTFSPPLAKQFSLALSRDDSANGNGGILTLGGIPDLTDPAVNASDSFTDAPWQFVASRSTNEYSFYSILVDGIVIGSSTVDVGFQILIDSGADRFQVTDATASAINGLWSSTNADGTHPCDAFLTEPIGVAIGGATYYIESTDLLVPNGQGTCDSLVVVGDTADNEFLVGDPLLKNTLAVFDWENQVMSFYPRQYYAS